jgi:hypothetical protein
MNLCRETVKMAVPPPPGNRRGLNPRRTLTVRSRVQGPRTPGRTVILFALAPLRSVPHRKRYLRQAGSQFHGRSSRFMNNPDYGYSS